MDPNQNRRFALSLNSAESALTMTLPLTWPRPSLPQRHQAGS